MNAHGGGGGVRIVYDTATPERSKESAEGR